MQTTISHLVKYYFTMRVRLFRGIIILLLFTAKAAPGQQFNYNYDSLKRIITLHPDDTSSIRAYIDYAAKYFYIKDDSGIYYLDKGIALARKKQDNFLYQYGLKNKGDYYSISGNFKKGIQIYKQALAVSSGQQGWLVGVKIKSNIAIAYKNMGLLDSAQLIYEDVMRAYNAHKNTHRDSLALAFSYIQLFDLYQVQGLTQEALFYGEKGYDLSRALNFDRGIGYGLYIQGLKYQNTNPEKALDYCEQAYQIAVSKKIADLEQFVTALKAKIYIHQKKYLLAEKVMLPAIRFTAGSAQQVTFAKLSEIYYHLDNLPKALMYFKQSYSLAETSGYHAELAEALVNGIAIYEKLNDYKNAFKLQQQYQQVQEQITSDKLKLDYQRSALKYKTAEKDKQLVQKQLLIAQKDNQLNLQAFLIALAAFVILLVVVLWLLHNRQQKKLQTERALAIEATKEIQTLEAMMKGEEKERQRIAKDLHDGIGGILSAIKMTVSTIRNQQPELKESHAFKNVIAMLDNASAEVRKTAHNLMPDMLARFGLEEAIHLFCTQISQRNHLIVDFQSLGIIERLPDNFELAIYRVVLELLNNVIKHAQASHALVQFSQQNNILTISIEDDGIGFNTDAVKTNHGLGLTSVRDRLSFLNGVLEIDSEPGKGTAVYLEFDVKHAIKHTKAV